MALIKILREQSAIGFDGKVILQDKAISQHLGQILICSGAIVGCSFSGQLGKKALVNLLIQEFSSSKDYDCVVEPELITLDKFQFEIEVLELEDEIREIIESSERNKNLRPPGDKRLLVNPDFICRGAQINSDEFDVLCLVSDFGKIQDIYDNSQLLEFEITNALVSLRKKGALKVLGTK